MDKHNVETSTQICCVEYYTPNFIHENVVVYVSYRNLQYFKYLLKKIGRFKIMWAQQWPFIATIAHKEIYRYWCIFDVHQRLCLYIFVLQATIKSKE